MFPTNEIYKNNYLDTLYDISTFIIAFLTLITHPPMTMYIKDLFSL